MTIIHLEINTFKNSARPGRCFYMSFTLFGQTLWIQRWAVRDLKISQVFLWSSDRLMGWTAGYRRGA